jgi:hypothetical protein
MKHVHVMREGMSLQSTLHKKIVIQHCNNKGNLLLLLQKDSKKKN